ncbi:MAG: alcohol dehydrogenase catalytic domain-containing protein [Ardenticatenaceae bacterium]|nr:alcohol dehydrogenase catalytic domain-containing protein [Ardenticatenaceae bacterium]
MKAVVFYEHGTLENVHYTDVAEPEIGPDEVLLAVEAAALNRLDLFVLEGWPGLSLKLPHIMGSDGAGVIARLGANVTDFAVGDRVAVNPTLFCGHCLFCRNGQENMCQHFAILGEHVDGFFADYTAVPARNLLKLPETVSFAAAAAASLVFPPPRHSLIKAGGFAGRESARSSVQAAVPTQPPSRLRQTVSGAGLIYGLARRREAGAGAKSLRQTFHQPPRSNWGKAVCGQSKPAGWMWC